jgi:hypothetical protein
MLVIIKGFSRIFSQSVVPSQRFIKFENSIDIKIAQIITIAIKL